MKNQLGLLTAAFLVALTTTATATIRYVDLNCTNATPPFTNWPTAATNIQDAVDAADVGDEVVVTNGVYASGGRAMYGTMTNRVAIDKALLVRSANGPLVTFITGQPSPITTTNGDGAIRCVYLGTNAVLSGFTLTNGHTRMDGDYYQEQSGGGVCCETSGLVTNCMLTGNSAKTYGGAAYSGTLNNCTLADNSAGFGGGTSYGTLNNCTLTGNSAMFGGGAYSGMLNNCALTGNWAISQGGGTISGTLSNCTLSGNSAGNSGGGALGCTLENCTLSSNWATYGGGAVGGTLNNCALRHNSASLNGGAASGCTLNNCTVTGNSALDLGGGAHSGTLKNCIVYYNIAANGPNYFGSALTNSCTTPLPSGPSNIEDEPLFEDTNGWSNVRLQPNSPCVNAGNNASATTSTDLDGNPRVAGGTVDMGAYEFQGTGLSGFTGSLWQHGLRVDGTSDDADSDGDTANNWREWVADTDPTNTLSVLKMLSPASAESGVTVSWQSVNTRSYFLERAMDIGAQPPFHLLQSNLTGQSGTTSYTDTNATGNGAFLYRVGVQE
jgi:hypothetical protein